ncbi:MAG TPA: hypothetical protein VG815_19005 [Chloroflexota bacterium]|nr:hypothetical protein [Chloroflexota bacterium]
MQISTTLDAISVLSPTDIWTSGAGYAPLVEHWNGRQWRVWWMAGSGPTSFHVVHDGELGLALAGGALSGIVALSDRNVWAVGYSDSGVIIVHWDGRRWHTVQDTHSGQDLLAVSAVSADDIWALGEAAGASSKAFVERWNGRRWETVRTTFSESTESPSILAVATDDVWAGGSMRGKHALIQHWNGRHWRAFRTALSDALNPITGFAESGASDIWAVSLFGALLRWDRDAWRMVHGSVKSPIVIYGAAVNGDRLFAIGDVTRGSSASHAISENWNGSDLTVTRLPEPNRTWQSELNGVGATSSQAWTVGDYTRIPANSGLTYPLIERVNFCRPTRLSS